MHHSFKKLTTCLIFSLVLSACDKAKPTKPVVTGVAYVGATVSNINRSAELYMQSASLEQVQSLDFTSEPVFDELVGRPNAKLSTRMLRSVNAQVRYMQFDSAPRVGPVEVQGPGIAHVCFQVNRATRTYETFLELGAQHIGSEEMQQLNPKNPVQYAYAKDIDGIVIEVEHVDFDKLDLEKPPENDYRIRHVSLSTPDISRLIDFYSEFLAQPKPRRLGRFWAFGSETMDAVSGLPDTKVKMAWFQLRNLELEIVEYVSHPTELPATPRPLDALGYNMIVFDVTNLEEAASALVAAGGTIISKPNALDGGQIVFGRDPDSNLIGLQVPDPNAIVASAVFKGNGT